MRFSLAAAAVILAVPAFAADAPAPVIQVISDEPLKGADNMHVVMANIDWPPFSTTGRHTHAGEEYAYVVLGTIEVDIDGQPPHIYKGGDYYHNARGVVHETKNLGTRTAKTFAILIVDKDAPLTQPVK
jgi:quercetin dioxygenase-like cupin family protein